MIVCILLSTGYTIKEDRYRFEVIADLPAEAWVKMNSCVKLRDEEHDTKYDTNYLEAVTEKQFCFRIRILSRQKVDLRRHSMPSIILKVA